VSRTHHVDGRRGQDVHTCQGSNTLSVTGSNKEWASVKAPVIVLSGGGKHGSEPLPCHGTLSVMFITSLNGSDTVVGLVSAGSPSPTAVRYSPRMKASRSPPVTAETP